MSLWLQDKLPTSTEVVVIGGGIAGVSVAYHLALKGVDVVLLEARDIASRASGRNDGQLLLGIGEHYHRVVSQFGPEKAIELWDFIEGNSNRLKGVMRGEVRKADLITAGGLHMAETEQEFEELRQTCRMLYQHGRDGVTLLNAAELTSLLPVEGFHGALRIPEESVVDPASLVKGLADRAAYLGAKIHTRARVAAICSADNGHLVQLEDDRSIETLMVVHCTSALATDLDHSGFLRAQTFPYRGQIIATDPVSSEQVGAFNGYAMSSNFGYEYFRTHQNRFMLGGMRWSVRGQEESITNDNITCETITKNLLGYVDKHFPTLKGVEFPHQWTGIMAGTNDGLPLVGAIPGQPGVFVLAAFNGYGLSFAFKAGDAISEQIIDGRASDPAVSMFDPRRFV